MRNPPSRTECKSTVASLGSIVVSVCFLWFNEVVLGANLMLFLPKTGDGWCVSISPLSSYSCGWRLLTWSGYAAASTCGEESGVSQLTCKL